jgi:putative flippase GtrA
MIKEKLRTIKKKELIGFLVGGGTAVLVDYSTYYLLMSMGVSVSLSKAISYVLGAAVGFVINKFWAFDSKQFSLREIGSYIILYAISALANTMTNAFALMIISWKIFAFLCATGVSTIINFLGQKFYVFKK